LKLIGSFSEKYDIKDGKEVKIQSGMIKRGWCRYLFVRIRIKAAAKRPCYWQVINMSNSSLRFWLCETSISGSKVVSRDLKLVKIWLPRISSGKMCDSNSQDQCSTPCPGHFFSSLLFAISSQQTFRHPIHHSNPKSSFRFSVHFIATLWLRVNLKSSKAEKLD
jgi:hypothetical protein